MIDIHGPTAAATDAPLIVGRAELGSTNGA